MGYTHGFKWNDDLIKQEILGAKSFYEIDYMPTRKMLKEYYQGNGLVVAISKRGGVMYWAEKLGLQHMGVETELGEKFEVYTKRMLENEGCKAELMRRRYPYDILVDDAVKIDVKVSRLYRSRSGDFHTFNLEKQNPTCDIYVAYCLSDDDRIERTYVIPAVKLKGIKQLSVGKESKYDPYLDRWDLITQYADFFAKYKLCNARDR